MTNTNKKRGSILAAFYIVFVVLGTFSLIHGWFPQFYRLVLLCFGIVMISVVLVPRYFTTKIFAFTFIYACIVYMNYRLGDAYTEGKEYLDGLVLASCGSMAFYFANSNDAKTSKWLMIVSLLIIVVDMVGTMAVYVVNPEIVRYVQSFANTGDNISTLEFYKIGIVEYDVLHGLPVLVPPLIMWIRHETTKTLWKIVAWSMLAVIEVLLYVGDATTPFLLSLIAIILSLLIVKNNHKKSVRRLIAVAIIFSPLLMFSDTLLTGALDAAYNVTDGELQKKIGDMKQMNRSGEMEGDMNVRYGLYEDSFYAFAKSPIIGTDNRDELGGHSAILDRMGAFGLIGIIPWLLVMIWLSRYNYKQMPHKARDFYLVGLFCFVAMMVLKNMSYFYVWFTFMVLLPCMLTFDVEKNK